jgi:hypothetical protein
MTGSTHLRQPGLLSGVFHFVIIGVAAQADDAGAWPYAFIAMSVVSFFAWLANFHRYRQIADLPTSKIASAAQGYVELFGKSEMVEGEAITSQLSGTPCCWYSYQIEEKNSKNEWSVRDSGQSVRHFHLVDDTGRCVISPDGAEVLTKDGRIWESGSERYTEWMLLPNSVLYAIGEFGTTTAAALAARDERADIGVLLAEWKDDQKQLLARFDLDHDGRIDMKEWELARLQAQREVRKRQSEMQARSIEGTSILRKPADGRLFLLANEMPDKLGARYRFWSWVHLAIFIGLGSAGLVML